MNPQIDDKRDGLSNDPRDNYIRTYSGLRFHPYAPEGSQIDIEDILQATSRICRFTGHCHQFYSVAQHSIFVAKLAWDQDTSQACALHALLHDAQEAYINDLATPVKQHLDDYHKLEAVVEEAIAHKFCLNWAIYGELIRSLDVKAYFLEREFLFDDGRLRRLKTASSYNLPVRGHVHLRNVLNLSERETQSRFRFLFEATREVKPWEHKNTNVIMSNSTQKTG